MFAITSLLAVVVVSLLVTRVATVIMVATGMPSQAARFQARSAFTGSGFTTTESEQIVDHPVRRKVVMWLMLLGNAGIVATASALILGLGHNGIGNAWLRILELVAGLAVLLYASRNAWVDRQLTRGIGYLLHRYTDLPTRDRATLLALAEDNTVSELAVTDGDWICRRALGELALRAEGINVLALQRPDGRWLNAPSAETALRDGDTLIVYGHAPDLAELDQRPHGAAGDQAHADAVERHERRRTAEIQSDPAPPHQT